MVSAAFSHAISRAVVAMQPWKYYKTLRETMLSAVLGRSWDGLGAILGLFGSGLGSLGSPGRSWQLFGGSWGVLGRS